MSNTPRRQTLATLERLRDVFSVVLEEAASAEDRRYYLLVVPSEAQEMLFSFTDADELLETVQRLRSEHSGEEHTAPQEYIFCGQQLHLKQLGLGLSPESPSGDDEQLTILREEHVTEESTSAADADAPAPEEAEAPVDPE